MEEDEDLSVFWDDFEEETEFSDELRPSTSNRTVPARSAFLVTCHVCSRRLRSVDGYKDHLKLHVLEEVYKTRPGQQAVMAECREKCVTVMREIAATKPGHGLTTDVAAVASSFLSLETEEQHKFSDIIAQDVWICIPSASRRSASDFHSDFMKGTCNMLADKDKRNEWLQCLREIVPVPVSDSVGNWCSAKLFRRLAVLSEAFYLHSLSQSAIQDPHGAVVMSDVDVASERDNADQVDFQQTVYYIGGSVVKGVLQSGLRAPNNECWGNVVECIRQKMLVNTLVEAPSEQVLAWTESLDRGGLKFIGESTWSFLMAFTGVLKRVEEQGGSVPHDKIWQAVKEDSVLLLMWSDIVEESLSKEDSDFLLNKICKSFTNTWGAGVALRLKNAVSRQARDKNALRASLLRR